MKLIAITHPYYFEGESEAICRLLDRGWWRVHVRKPDTSPAELARLLGSIPDSYRQSLSLHDHFDMAEEFALGGIHLNSRCPLAPARWRGLVSRSCHSLDEISRYPQLDYLTLSPIFDSISKPGYRSRFDIDSLKGADLSKVFALGGVTRLRLGDVKSAGFAGAAMLTEAWKTRNHMLQFITHTYDGLEEALEGGCRWVQLRMKDASDDEFSIMAKRFIPLCRRYSATLIFDDRVGPAATLGADGVHLGKNDMPVAEARRILGPSKIIGATANTAEDVIAAYRAGSDYVGLGPFRFTTTKKNLSPILGLNGYRDIMSRCRQLGVTLPVVAIGGIELDDLDELRRSGVDGIAVSGLILNSHDKKQTTAKIIEKWQI